LIDLLLLLMLLWVAIHSMAPAIASQIPIFIRNTFRPDLEGTQISLLPHKRQELCERSVCGFSTVDDLALLNLEGSGIIGVSGIAQRLFGTLKSISVPVLFVAQASSEHNICFATKSLYVTRAVHAINETFYFERSHHILNDVRVIHDCAIIVAVGDAMNTVLGVAGHFLSALGDANINVISVAQGCDERSIAAVVRSVDATKALRAVHSAFSLSAASLSIAVVGTGRVGTALLRTLSHLRELLEQRLGLRITIRGISNSVHMLLGEDLCDQLDRVFEKRNADQSLIDDLSGCNTDFFEVEGAQPVHLQHFLQHIREAISPHAVIVDATTSTSVAALHPQWMRSGCHVVTANKRAISQGLSLYKEVFAAARSARRMYMSEVILNCFL
jgi:bifunctional aspartokinase / homoserine dehydrogenase 1